jgi:hypothetical protein
MIATFEILGASHLVNGKTRPNTEVKNCVPYSCKDTTIIVNMMSRSVEDVTPSFQSNKWGIQGSVTELAKH